MRYFDDKYSLYFKFIKKDKIVTIYQIYNTSENLIFQLPESFQPKKPILVGEFYRPHDRSLMQPDLLCVNGANLIIYPGPTSRLYDESELNVKYNIDSAFIGQYRLD